MRLRTASGRLSAALIALVPVAVLWALAPPATVAASVDRGLHADDGGVLLVTASAGLVAWAVVCWLAVGVLAAAAAVVPGRVGRLGRVVAVRITPALLRRLLSGGTVAGLALSPVVLPAAAQAGTRSSMSGCIGAAPSLDRAPLGCPVVTSAAVPTSVPAPTSPTSTPITAPTQTPTTTRATTTVPASHHPVRPAAVPATVVVRSGDSLWSLARAELRASRQPATSSAVAALWPAWWAANRAELGDDPGLIRPGEVLLAPTT